MFFDRTIGVRLPRLLKKIRKLPFGVAYHEDCFKKDERDDVWLPEVGMRGWFVIGQDYRYHARPTELDAIKENKIGCFYLWGSQAPQWDYVRVFAKSYYNLASIALTVPRPFLYVVNHQADVRPWGLNSKRIPFGKSPKRLPIPQGSVALPEASLLIAARTASPLDPPN